MPFSLELAILLNLFMMGLKTSSPFLRNKILNIKLSPGNTFPTTLEQQRQFGDMKKKQSFRLKSNANIASSSEGSSFQYQDWSSVVTFWREVIKNPHKLPIFIKGDGKYGTTDLQPIFQAGNRFEFQSVDMRYTKISTYALSFGYDGTKFFGYQSQRNSSARAVQDVLIEAIGHKCIAAGRTDKDVSAIGQIVSFSSSKPDYHKTVLAQLRAHQSVESGK